MFGTSRFASRFPAEAAALFFRSGQDDLARIRPVGEREFSRVFA